MNHIFRMMRITNVKLNRDLDKDSSWRVYAVSVHRQTRLGKQPVQMDGNRIYMYIYNVGKKSQIIFTWSTCSDILSAVQHTLDH